MTAKFSLIDVVADAVAEPERSVRAHLTCDGKGHHRDWYWVVV
jgi:hypothetical protein